MYSKNCIEKWYPNWVKKNIVHTKKNYKLISEILIFILHLMNIII